MPKRSVTVFYNSEHPNIANFALVQMWREIGGIRFSRFPKLVRLVDRYNHTLPGGNVHRCEAVGLEIDGLLKKQFNVSVLLHESSLHLAFTDREVCRGTEELQAMGVPADASFVCFHARSPAYLERTFPGRDWEYHDYRDAKSESYDQAMEVLTKLGLFVLRMGAVVDEDLGSDDPRVVDYARGGHRSEFMDLFLCHKCLFFLGDSSGLADVPNILRRPVVRVNSIPLNIWLNFGEYTLLIPKKLWSISEGRYLTFSEMVNSELRLFGTTQQYKDRGIEVIQNSPEEIVAVTLEMFQRLNGMWEQSEEDDKRQELFWSLWPQKEMMNMRGNVYMGTEFLRQNQSLLM